MKTDFTSLKKELKRLTDVGELKKELNRLATDIRGFDLTTAIPTSQRARVEKRYRSLKKSLTDLQTRLDQSFARVSSFVRKSSGKKVTTVKKSSRKAAGKTTTRKKVAKKAAKKVQRAKA